MLVGQMLIIIAISFHMQVFFPSFLNFARYGVFLVKSATLIRSWN